MKLKAISMAIVFLFIVSGLMILPHPTKAIAFTSNSQVAKNFAVPSLSLSFAYPSPEDPTFIYTKITYFPTHPLYFRLIGMNQTGGATLHTYSNSTITQAISGLSWYVNTTDGFLKLVYTFGAQTDATNDNVLIVYGNVTSCTNATKYNTTTLFQYAGINSGVDQTWKAGVISSDHDYYALASSANSHKQIRHSDGDWQFVTSNSNAFLSGGGRYIWYMTGNVVGTGYGASNEAYSYWLDDFLRMAIKFKTPAQYPITAPKMLQFAPESNWSQWVAMQNESIYEEAANTYHFTHIAIWGYWMNVINYQARNASVDAIIHQVINYTHEYGMQFTLYFGWRDFTNFGAFKPVYLRNDRNTTVMQNSWANYSSLWGPHIDYYYFDYAMISINSYTDEYANYYDWLLLDPIFSSIRTSTGKDIFYNANMYAWWIADEGFYPVKFEGQNIVNADNHWQYLYWDDPFAHNLKYPSIWWFEGTFFTGNSYNPANAWKSTRYAYLWGITPAGAWTADPDEIGISPYSQWFRMWTVGTEKVGNVTGAIGRSAILENASSIAIIMENLKTTIDIDPILRPSATTNNYYVSLDAINDTIVGNISILHIEIMVNKILGITITDVNTGADIDWSSGSIRFTATTGHLYLLFWNEYPQAIRNLGIIIGMFMVLGIVVSILVPIVQVAQEKRKFKVDDLINMVIYIVVSVSLIGLVYALLP